MKFKKPRSAKKGRIEIIPMIDVMFFLLITFMLTSLAAQKINSLPVNLTEGKANQALIDKEQITFTIDRENRIYLGKKLISLEEIATTLPALLPNVDATIIITFDKKAEAGIVTQTMLKAKAAGAKHFSIIIKKA
jgi:biopolymer transport protein ExbD